MKFQFFNRINDSSDRRVEGNQTCRQRSHRFRKHIRHAFRVDLGCLLRWMDRIEGCVNEKRLLVALLDKPNDLFGKHFR